MTAQETTFHLRRQHEAEIRRQRKVQRLVELGGARLVYELLNEIETGTAPDAALDALLEIPIETLRALGGDCIPPAPFAVSNHEKSE